MSVGVCIIQRWVWLMADGSFVYGHRDHEAAVNRLLNLRIWRQQALPGGLSGITVSADFQDNIKTVVLGG